jgi:hypothetical protein
MPPTDLGHDATARAAQTRPPTRGAPSPPHKRQSPESRRREVLRSRDMVSFKTTETRAEARFPSLDTATENDQAAAKRARC